MYSRQPYGNPGMMQGNFNQRSTFNNLPPPPGQLGPPQVQQVQVPPGQVPPQLSQVLGQVPPQLSHLTGQLGPGQLPPHQLNGQLPPPPPHQLGGQLPPPPGQVPQQLGGPQQLQMPSNASLLAQQLQQHHQHQHHQQQQQQQHPQQQQQQPLLSSANTLAQQLNDPQSQLSSDSKLQENLENNNPQVATNGSSTSANNNPLAGLDESDSVNANGTTTNSGPSANNTSVNAPSSTSNNLGTNGTTTASNADPGNVNTANNNSNNASAGASATGNKALNDEKVYRWIIELVYGPDKEQALLELGKKREYYDDLALVLWHSFGVMTSLLEEIVNVYTFLSPPELTTPVSNRVCNALALLQCVASHPDTRTPFLNAHIPLLLYPFLNTNSKQRPFEYLRLTSLGVIGALVKNDTPEVISFLLTTEIIPLCLKIMESSSELSKTVAIFIVQKILMDDTGLGYICHTFDRFEAVSNVLKIMIDQLITNPTARLLKHVIKCYLRLADNPDARKALKDRLPIALKDNSLTEILKDDQQTKQCLIQLLNTVE